MLKLFLSVFYTEQHMQWTEFLNFRYTVTHIISRDNERNNTYSTDAKKKKEEKKGKKKEKQERIKQTRSTIFTRVPNAITNLN